KKSERRAAVRTGLQRYGTRGQCARLWYLAGLGLGVETIMSDERQAGRPETRSAVRSRGCLPEKSCVRYYDAGDDLGHNRSWATSLGIKILRSRNADQFRLEIYSCLAWVYRLMAHILGNEANRQWFIDDVLCLRDGQKLVDVGCGHADILDRLPGVEYVGLDISDLYIQAARAKFKTRSGTKFLSGSVEDWTRNPLTYEADVVLANGVLHHVD